MDISATEKIIKGKKAECHNFAFFLNILKWSDYEVILYFLFVESPAIGAAYQLLIEQ
jgi:hypothetical protein